MRTFKASAFLLLCATISVRAAPHHHRPEDHGGDAEEPEYHGGGRTPKYRVLLTMNGGPVQYEVRSYGKRSVNKTLHRCIATAIPFH